MLEASKPRTYTLRRASSIVLALISVLPQLLFIYTISALDALHHRVAQLGLGSALVLSMIGFYIYSIMMSRLADILLEIETAAAALPPSGAPQGPGVGRRGGFSGQSPSGVPDRGGLSIPGMGRIAEVAPAGAKLVSEIGSMWQAEAEPLLRQRVLVAARNAPDPIRGILAQVTQDGVIIDQGGSKTRISYARLSVIEADTTPNLT